MPDSRKENTAEVSLWGKLVEKIWPIYPSELKKIIPMIFILFGALFSYTLVRNIKDAILITAPHSSAPVLSWTKLFVVTPGSILFVIMYAKLSNLLSRERLFFAVLGFFSAFFLLFALVLYPLNQMFNFAPETVLAWQQNWPGLKDFIPVLGYWLYAFFYMMAELWGNIAVGILFWQFANQITATPEAKRFYPFFGLWSNLALISAGLMLRYSEHFLCWVLNMDDVKHIQVQFLCIMAVFGAAIMGFAYRWIDRNVLGSDDYVAPSGASGASKKVKKPKLSLKESFSVLFRSQYLRFITVLVLAYGIVINLVEISWKNTVKAYLKGDQAAYMGFTGNQYIYTGLLTMVLILFCQNVVRVFGWRIGASVTPLVSLVAGSLFFAFLIFQGVFQDWFNVSDTIILGTAMWMGLAHNCLTKASKYALFDPTKEMAYIPLDEESKVKGKAAIDVVGGRAGKSGGSAINVLFSSMSSRIMGVGNMMSLFYVSVGAALLVISFWWLWAVNGLAKLYVKKVGEKEASAEEALKKSKG